MTTVRLMLLRCAVLLLLLTGGAVAFGQPPIVVVATDTAANNFEEIRGYLYGAIALCILLPLVPIGAYLRTGWRAKRNDITAGVSEEAKRRYLQMFSLSDPAPRGAGPRGPRLPANRRHAIGDAVGGDRKAGGHDQVFEDFYKRWYGRHRYAFPILVFVGVLAFLSVQIGYSAASLFPYWKAHEPTWTYSLDPTALSAIAGAYLWVTSDFIRRARRLDFAPSDINWGTLRLVIAVPMGYAFAGFGQVGNAGQVADTGQVVASVIAFSLGALPLSAIQDILRQTLYKRFTTTVHEEDRTDAVTQLQGIDDEIAMRLESENVTTIPQLAYCDPVRLVMRSNLTFNFVIDCMNQALCWVYFESQLANLRPLGLRGAVEISVLLDALASADPQIRSDAESTLADVVAAIKPPHTAATLRYTFAQIAGNPYTHFLKAVSVNPFLVSTEDTLPETMAGTAAAWNGAQDNRTDGDERRTH